MKIQKFYIKEVKYISTTRIIPIHKNKGKSIQKYLSNGMDYILNSDKTENMTYVSSFACDPHTADLEFALSKNKYFNLTGRVNENDIIAYHLRQSFKPGEITPEDANKVSYELASRLLKGQHAFIVATHTDKHHIHSHIIFNSTSLDCSHKFRNPIGSYRDIRKLADLICTERNLSVISSPGISSPSYNKWDGCKQRLSNRDILKSVIDEIIENGKPKTFEDLLSSVQKHGYEIKYGKNIAFKGFNQQKYIRLKSLGDDYSEDSLKLRITGEKKKSTYNKERPSMLIDIEKAMAEGKGIGYQNWAKTFNLKQMAKSFSYLQENNLLSYAELSNQLEEEKSNIENLEQAINSANKRLDEISELKKHIINYSKHSNMYAEYKRLNKSKAFKQQHQKEFDEFVAAKKYFDSLNLDKKLPSIKELNKEFNSVLSTKRKAYNELYPAKKEHRKHLIYQENVRILLDIDKKQIAKSSPEH